MWMDNDMRKSLKDSKTILTQSEVMETNKLIYGELRRVGEDLLMDLHDNMTSKIEKSKHLRGWKQGLNTVNIWQDDLVNAMIRLPHMYMLLQSALDSYLTGLFPHEMCKMTSYPTLIEFIKTFLREMTNWPFFTKPSCMDACINVRIEQYNEVINRVFFDSVIGRIERLDETIMTGDSVSNQASPVIISKRELQPQGRRRIALRNDRNKHNAVRPLLPQTNIETADGASVNSNTANQLFLKPKVITPDNDNTQKKVPIKSIGYNKEEGSREDTVEEGTDEEDTDEGDTDEGDTDEGGTTDEEDTAEGGTAEGGTDERGLGDYV